MCVCVCVCVCVVCVCVCVCARACVTHPTCVAVWIQIDKNKRKGNLAKAIRENTTSRPRTYDNIVKFFPGQSLVVSTRHG